MKVILIEVITRHYTGPLTVKPDRNDHSLFSVYLNGQLLGRMQPVRKSDHVAWYSHQITDKELVEQIGEWIVFHYTLTDKSFRTIYSFKLFTVLFIIILCCLLYSWFA